MSPPPQFKYIIDGVLAIKQNGQQVSAVAGDIVHIPKVRLSRAGASMFDPDWFR